MKKLIFIPLLLFVHCLFAATPSKQEMTNYVAFTVPTNYTAALSTNFNTFFIANGTPANVVRSNYTLAPLLSGVVNFTNDNGKVLVASNAFTVDGFSAWTLQTNDGTLKSTTNTILYYNTNQSGGYPSGTWQKGLLAGATAPSMGISSFLVTTNATATGYAVSASSRIIVTPENSNSIVARVETWGSDVFGVVGGYPFKSYGEVNYLSTNTVPYPIFFGAGWHTNISGGSGYAPRGGLLAQQVLAGKGPGVTIVGASSGSGVLGSLTLNNSNVLRDMTFLGTIVSPNTGTTSITNFTEENVVHGQSNGIDCVTISGAALYDAHFTRDTFISCFDTMNGVMTGEFNDCTWRVIGFTNDPALSSAGALRPIYLQGAISSFTNNITLNGGRIFAACPYTNATIPQAVFVLSHTNDILTINGTAIYHATNVAVFTNASGIVANNKFVNGWYPDVGMTMDLTTVLSVNGVTVKSGVITTNY